VKALWVASILVFCILVLATFISRIISFFYTTPELEKVWLRIKSWWIIALLPLVCLYFGPIAVTALFSVVMIISINEFLKLVDPSFKKHREVVFFGIPLVVFAAIISWKMQSSSWSLVFIFMCFVMLAWAGLVKSKYTVFFGMIFFVSALSSISILSQSHIEAVFYLLFLTSLNDVFQYLFGKTFGKSKLAPIISPAKTWEGLLGGVVASGFLSVLLAPYFLTADPITAFLIGVSLSIAGTVGDLTISKFKRGAKVSDTGSLLPGHGGILDRVDSLCLTAPTFYFIIQAFIPALNLMKGLK